MFGWKKQQGITHPPAFGRFIAVLAAGFLMLFVLWGCSSASKSETTASEAGGINDHAAQDSIIVTEIPQVTETDKKTPEAATTEEETTEASTSGWTEQEKKVLRTLWIGSLPALPADPSNAYADDPKAAELGQKLYFDTRLSADGNVACATCHKPDLAFTDGLTLSHGVGVTGRNAPTVIGSAYSPWMFWDGRRDSQWAQALGPLESAVEHGGSRTQYAHLIAEQYKAEYEAVFGALPDLSDATRFPPKAGPVEDEGVKAVWEKMTPEDQDTINRIYANIGKAIAAFERPIVPISSPFDEYVNAVLDDDVATMKQVYTADQEAGLRLYIGQAKCLTCHNGPLFTNNTFQNIGVPDMGMPADSGRAAGIPQVVADEFNCMGKYSDAENKEECTVSALVDATPNKSMEGAFRTPTLRDIAETGPYMHHGQMQTLREVLDFYNKGIPQEPALNLTEQEVAQLEAFLGTLSGPVHQMTTTAQRQP